VAHGLTERFIMSAKEQCRNVRISQTKGEGCVGPAFGPAEREAWILNHRRADEELKPWYWYAGERVDTGDGASMDFFSHCSKSMESKRGLWRG
jgi:hypothetical protein